MTGPRRRRPDRLRRVRLVPDFIRSADGSCLIELGRTRVVCTATVEPTVPAWLRDRGTGWVTAEYGMLPASARERVRRPGPGGPGGRASEIRRLIGRALRAGVDLDALGPVTVVVDCDVLEADGGTRCAAITGGWVALVRALRRAEAEGRLPPPTGEGDAAGPAPARPRLSPGRVRRGRRGLDLPAPVREQVVAVSCGLVEGQALLDLDYRDDSRAEVDANVVMTAAGRLVEVQATAEGRPFAEADLARLLALARKGCRTLAKHQARAVKRSAG